jgi:hypothetical protein
VKYTKVIRKRIAVVITINQSIPVNPVKIWTMIEITSKTESRADLTSKLTVFMVVLLSGYLPYAVNTKPEDKQTSDPLFTA